MHPVEEAGLSRRELLETMNWEFARHFSIGRGKFRHEIFGIARHIRWMSGSILMQVRYTSAQQSEGSTFLL
jgi:hypothetical protein